MWWIYDCVNVCLYAYVSTPQLLVNWLDIDEIGFIRSLNHKDLWNLIRAWRVLLFFYYVRSLHTTVYIGLLLCELTYANKCQYKAYYRAYHYQIFH